MSAIKSRIAELLANGATQVQVARATGVSESYVCQLLTEDTEFEQLLAKYASANLEQDLEIEKAYTTVEGNILTELDSKLVSANVRELSMALAAVTANKRNKTLSRNGNNGMAVSMAVTVQLPAHAVEDLCVVKNDRTEIVEMGGRNFRGLTETEFLSSLPVLQQDTSTGVYNEPAVKNSDSKISARLEEVSRLAGQ